MKKGLKIKVLLTVVMAIVGATSAQAWNPGTHIFTAERVFPFCLDKIDLYYGSIAPDLALYVPQNLQTNWPLGDAFYDTHYEFIDLRKDAWGFLQQAFAKGWLIHNENAKYRVVGADYYAHVCPPYEACTKSQDGYVYRKARELLNDRRIGGCLICSEPENVNLELAHSAIEIAVDVLIKQYNDPKLAKKLLEATLLRSWRDLVLLNKVLVSEGKATDSLTLASAEISFRNIAFQYAMALSTSTIENMRPLAILGSQITEGILSPGQVLPILLLAIDLCDPDYNQVIQGTIQNIKSDLR
jgi:hypothetical protein